MAVQRDFNYRGLVLRICMIEQRDQRRYEAFIGHEKNGDFIPVPGSCVESFANEVWASDALESMLRQAQSHVDFFLREEPQRSSYRVHHPAGAPFLCHRRPIGLSWS